MSQSDGPLYPVVVFSTRFGGMREGAPWAAIEAHADPGLNASFAETNEDLRGCQSDAESTREWFQRRAEEGLPTGLGDTPDEAVRDLARQLNHDWEPGDDALCARFERSLREAEERRQ